MTGRNLTSLLASGTYADFEGAVDLIAKAQKEREAFRALLAKALKPHGYREVTCSFARMGGGPIVGQPAWIVTAYNDEGQLCSRAIRLPPGIPDRNNETVAYLVLRMRGRWVTDMDPAGM